MKRLHFIISIILGCMFFPSKGQHASYSINLDSARVINNAIVMRTNARGYKEYVMMPTQYGKNLAIGKPLVVTVEDSPSTYQSNVYKFEGLDGMVVNDMVLKNNNTILFGGYRNGKAVYGTLDMTSANFTINVICDNNALHCKAIAYRSFSGVDYLFTGDQWTSDTAKISSFSTSGGGLSLNTTCNFANTFSHVDVALSQHTTLSSVYGVSIGRISSHQVAIFRNALSNLQTSLLGKRKVDLPSNWQWHEGGGSVVRIAADIFVAALDVRCDTAEKDGIWLLKFTAANTTINMIDAKLIEFPTRKLTVKDLYFVNDLKKGGKLCIAGQYIDATVPSSGYGCPFILQIDTNFTNERVKRFAMHYPDYEKRNFTLNKMCYNAATYNIIAVGSYWRYLPTYQKGGIYFAVNSVFSNTSPQACVEELAVTHESTTRHISSISGIYAITTGYESDVRTSICSSSLNIILGCPRNISPDGSKK